MAIYGRSNGFGGSTTYDVPVAEGYNGVVGASQILIESIQNDLALFEAVIANDFKEVTLGESATDTDYQSIYEAAGVGFIDKIKEFVKKVWEKIKGLFHSFMTNLNNVVIRSNKEFVAKYKNEVMKKTFNDNFKYTWRRPKKEYTMPESQIGAISTKIDKEYTYDILVGKSAAELDAYRKESTSEKTKEALYGASLPTPKTSCSPSDFDKEYVDALFEDSEEYEGLDSSTISSIMSVLTESSKSVDILQKNQKEVDKIYSKRLAALDKVRSEINKLVPNKEGEGKSVDVESEKRDLSAKGSAEHASKAISTMYEGVKLEQEILTKVASLQVSCMKFHITQSRSLFAKAAAWNPKKVNEASLLEAVGQAEEHELEIMFEGAYAY